MPGTSLIEIFLEVNSLRPGGLHLLICDPLNQQKRTISNLIFRFRLIEFNTYISFLKIVLILSKNTQPVASS